MTELQWEQQEALWNAAGEAVECTTSTAVSQIKAELEKLCSVASCNYPTQQRILEGLDRMAKLKTRVMP